MTTQEIVAELHAILAFLATSKLPADLKLARVHVSLEQLAGDVAGAAGVVDTEGTAR